MWLIAWNLLGQFLAGLFVDDVVGVPVRPICIVFAAPSFMIAVCRGGAPQRCRMKKA
ncbi:hypothetical protein [Bradyrhizobium rifense]|uniref:hypothetical protein n=1 Tax=Bradyrhizobium rifense TaxID=515499 RepID=UPI001652D5E1